MNRRIQIPVPEKNTDRIDKLISTEETGLTRSSAQKLIAQGRVLFNGKRALKSAVPQGGIVEIEIPAPVPISAEPEDIPLEILYEDGDLLVVNKPKGMVVHPAAGNADGTLVNALLYHCGDSLSGINGAIRPGIVHRIDKDTSGLLIVAKNDAAHQGLARQIKDHSFTRIYEAVVYGRLKEDEGRIEAPIGRHPVKRKMMAVVENGRPAVTHYTVTRVMTVLRIFAFGWKLADAPDPCAYGISWHPVAGDRLRP